MSLRHIVKSLIAVPFLALGGAIIGTVFSAIILLINYAILTVGEFQSF